ncbi:hypothetical protein WPG_1088 [Winogradskyella sp. PG-2]|nr:hypothetical protein WPG_1088 [Winogradskyella sp. PG-2]
MVLQIAVGFFLLRKTPTKKKTIAIQATINSTFKSPEMIAYLLN